MPKSLARMTARSVVLSVMLGAHPAWASVAELIRLTADFDIKEATLRVALTRMVSAGDLVRSADGYRLTDRLLPDELLPRQWPGMRLRAAYNDFAAELLERRDDIGLVEAT